MIPIQLNYDGLLGKCTIKTELYSIPLKGDCVEFMFNNEFLCIASVYQISHLIMPDCCSVVLFITDKKQEENLLGCIVDNKKMTDLALNYRAGGCLKRYFLWEINDDRYFEEIPLSDWQKVRISRLRRVRGLGKKSLDEIIEAFAEYGIILNN